MGTITHGMFSSPVLPLDSVHVDIMLVDIKRPLLHAAQVTHGPLPIVPQSGSRRYWEVTFTVNMSFYLLFAKTFCSPFYALPFSL